MLLYSHSLETVYITILMNLTIFYLGMILKRPCVNQTVVKMDDTKIILSLYLLEAFH